ncbi:MAG: RING finger domain-containing protein [Candidatus Babeliales bacterium]
MKYVSIFALIISSLFFIHGMDVSSSSDQEASQKSMMPHKKKSRRKRKKVRAPILQQPVPEGADDPYYRVQPIKESYLVTVIQGQCSKKKPAEYGDNDCAICVEEMGTYGKIKKLACNHYFCAACIIAWEKKSHDCPMCRAPFTLDSVSIVPLNPVNR